MHNSDYLCMIICLHLFVYNYIFVVFEVIGYEGIDPTRGKKLCKGLGPGYLQHSFSIMRGYIYIYGALDANTLSRHHKKSEFLTKRLSWPRPHGALIYLSERLVTDRRFPRRSQGIRTYV